jgi:hypothetical protein
MDSSGTYNLGAMGSNVFNSIVVQSYLSGTNTLSLINVPHDASLSIDASLTGTTGILNYQAADATGASDVVTVNLGTSATDGITVGNAGDTGGTVQTSSLTMQDANNVGIGTLNIVSNASSNAIANKIVALADSGLSNLNVSGVDGLTITILNEGATAGTTATAATSFNINNTSGGTVKIGTLTDSALGSLTFTGTGNDQITTLYNGTTSHALTITDTGTGTATITTLSGNSTTEDSLTSLTLGAGVALGLNSSSVTNMAITGLQDVSTAGVTVSGSADNAHVVANLTYGAASGNTDSITLGNGNDYITDDSTAGTVNVTVGTGSNLINLSDGGGIYTGSSSSATTQSANNTYAASVTLGTHTSTTGSDLIQVGVVDGTVAGSSTAWSFIPTAAANTVITGAVAGDQLIFRDTSTDKAANVTAIQQTAITAANNIGAAVALAFGETAQHEALSFQYGGNTYVVEQAGATNAALAAGDSIVELVGTHTLSTTLPSADHIALA